MSNFSTATEATSTALDSAGSAAKENSKYMEGLEAKTQAVKESFEELSNTVIDSGLVKGILDLANGFLQLLNTPIGSFITQITLLTGVLWGGTGLIQAMKLIPNLLSGVITAASGATSILSLSVPQLALIAAGIAAIIAIAPSFSNWYKETTNDVDYANEKLEENNSKLSENKTRLEELEKIPVTNRTPSIEAEIEALKNENAELEKNIDYWDSKSAQGALEDVSGYKVDYELAQQDNNLGRAITLETLPLVKNTEEAIKVLKQFGLINKDVQDTLEGTGYTLEQAGNSFKVVAEEPKQFITTWEEYYQTLLTRQKEIEQVFKSGGEITADMVIEYEKITEELNNYANIVERADKVSHSANETQLELAKGIRETEITYQELADSIYTVEDSLQILSEGQALNEIQVEQLLEKYPELESAIKQVGDAYSIEQEALYNLASAGNEAARQLVESQIKATEKTIQKISERIEGYKKEISSLKEAFNVQNILNAAGKGMQSLLGYTNTYSNDLADLILKLSSAEKTLSSYQTSLEELKSQQSSWDAPLTSISTGGEEGSKGSKEETNPIEEQSKAFKEQNAIIEHNIFLREKQGASEEELIQLNKNYQEELHKQAEWYRAQGLDDTSEYIRDTQTQWWNLQDTIEGIYDNISKASEEAAEKTKEAWEEQKEAVINWIQSEIDDLENLFSTVVNQAQKEIDLLEEEKQKVEDYYQNQIDALEEANKELERQIELEEALDDLARARQTKVMVYKDGRFQYVEDIDEISEAQSSLEKIERENALNDKINALEEEKQAELDKLNASIEYWENYLEGFGDFVNDYEEEQNKKYLSDKYNIQLEGENWEASLSQLSNYVERYKQLQTQLNTVQNSQYGSSSGNAGSKDWSQIWWDAENDPTLSESERQEIQDWAHSQKEQEMAGSGAVFDKNSGQWHYASGTFSASGGLSLVGENGPELRVLGQGDGIIPSDITKNLWAWGVTTPASMMNNIVGSLQSMGQQIGITIQNFNPNLPNVQDGQGFANYMRTNFWREAIQFAKA